MVVVAAAVAALGFSGFYLFVMLPKVICILSKVNCQNEYGLSVLFHWNLMAFEHDFG